MVQGQRQDIYNAQFNGIGNTSGNGWIAIGRNGCPGGFFGTSGGSFELTDYEGSGCCDGQQGGANDSELNVTGVDISNFVDVEVTVIISTNGGNFESGSSCLGGDLLLISHNTGGGNGSSGGNNFNLNAGSNTYVASGICGRILNVNIRFGTQAVSESIFIDTIIITGIPDTPPTAAGNGEIIACEGETAVLDVINSDGAVIEWERPNGPISSNRDNPQLVIPNVTAADQGLYIAAVFTPNCSDGFIIVEFEVFLAPGLPSTVRVSDEVVCEGETAVLNAIPQGNFIYEWIGPDGPIPSNNNSPQLVIPNVSLGDAGDYSVFVADPAGGECAAGEATGILEVLQGPGQASILGSAFLCAGERGVLTVETVNPGNYEYVWFKDGEEIADTNRPVLNIDDAGFYDVVVTSEEGCISEDTGFEVIELEGPGIVSADDQIVCAGQTVAIPIRTSNNGNWTYTWQRILVNDTIEDVPTEFIQPDGSLLIEAVRKVDAGIYFSIVSDEEGNCAAELNGGAGIILDVVVPVDSTIAQDSIFCDLENDSEVDLELCISTDNPDIGQWERGTFTFTLENKGAKDATGVVVSIELPTENIVQVGGSVPIASSGNYDGFRGVWQDISVPSDSQQTLQLQLFNKIPEINLYAQVSEQEQKDMDSEAGNGMCCIALEDDEATFPSTCSDISNRSNFNNSYSTTEASNNWTVSNPNLSWNITPNPTSQVTTLQLKLSKASVFRVDLLNIHGQPVRTIIQQTEPSMELQTTIDVQDLERGIYFLQTQYNGGVEVERLVVQ